MIIYDNILDAIEYINNSDTEYKPIKINNIRNQKITKINNTILIVDEYNILKD